MAPVVERARQKFGLPGFLVGRIRARKPRQSFRHTRIFRQHQQRRLGAAQMAIQERIIGFGEQRKRAVKMLLRGRVIAFPGGQHAQAETTACESHAIAERAMQLQGEVVLFRSESGLSHQPINFAECMARRAFCLSVILHLPEMNGLPGEIDSAFKLPLFGAQPSQP